eukprot:m.96291 g.96291  ORF g.96291 m.96291 type:complete len:228 (-) comp10155_c0_seq2:92-775(-)
MKVPGTWARRPMLSGLGVQVTYTLDRPGGATVSVARGSVVDFRGDVIVNAANEGGLGGGGVDGAINRAGGAVLEQARMDLPVVEGDEDEDMYSAVRIPTGDARLTVGGDLPGMVIHAVGPMYFGAEDDFATLDAKLQSAYAAAFDLARAHNLRRVGCALISSGVFSGNRGLDNILRLAWQTAVECGNELDIVLVAFAPHEWKILMQVAREDPWKPVKVEAINPHTGD